MRTNLSDGTQSLVGSFLRKYRFLWIAGLGWVAFLLLFFFLKHAIPPRFFIHSPLDDLIPFVKWFVFAYCLWYLYMAGTLLYFAFTSKPDFIRLQIYIFVGLGICLFIYVVYPNAIAFRPTVTGTDVAARLTRWLFSADTANMVTPSMHVFAAVAVHLSLVKGKRTHGNRPLLAISFVVMALISASTVLLKQHSILDVFWGIVLALVLYFPFYYRRKA